ncbi:hypothetical protein U1Q18_040896 [Sarracenia purpurea var. burkii]
MSALAKRIQRLKGLSPIKFELSPPVGRTRGGKESKIENPVVMEVKPSICVTTQQGNPSLLSAPPSGVAAEAIKPEEGKSGSASADLNPTTAGSNEDSFESGSESLEEEEEGESHGGTTDDDTETSKSDGPGDVPFKEPPQGFHAGTYGSTLEEVPLDLRKLKVPLDHSPIGVLQSPLGFEFKALIIFLVLIEVMCFFLFFSRNLLFGVDLLHDDWSILSVDGMHRVWIFWVLTVLCFTKNEDSWSPLELYQALWDEDEDCHAPRARWEAKVGKWCPAVGSMETSGFQLADVSGEQTFSWGAVCNGCGSRRLHPQDSGFLIFVRMSSTWRALLIKGLLMR